MTTIQRTNLYRPLSDISSFKEAHAYSRMKHGCVECRSYFSYLLALKVLEIYRYSQNYLIAGSSFLSVPNASNQLLQDMIRLHLGCNFKRTLLRRKQITPVDYALLKERERENMKAYLAFDFSYNELKGQSLIVVDDSRVTGTHEQMIIDKLDGVVKKLHFFYIVDLAEVEDATIEDKLNRFAVKSIFDIIPMRSHGRFQYNNRVVKLIFQSEDDEFNTFMSTLPSDEQDYIFQLAEAEGLFLLERFRKRKSQRGSSLMADA